MCSSDLLKRIEYTQKLNAVYTPPKYTAVQLLQAYEKYFNVDLDNKYVVDNICKYFAEDDAGMYDLNKGLMIYGNVGVGKTTLMRLFTRNQKASYKIVSCRDIENDFSTSGDKSVATFSVNLPIAQNTSPFSQTEIGYCFDDLGTEVNGKFYGKDKNVMAEILLDRYDNKLPYHYTHVTTNLTAADIKEQYGTRVSDRLREMMNIVSFPTKAQSRRT